MPPARSLVALALSSALLAQTHLYSTNTGSGSVTVTDPRTRTVLATIAVGASPVDLAFHPDATRAYVANFRARNVAVLDTATRQVTGTVTVGDYPAGVGVTRDGRKLYVVLDSIGRLLIVDTASLAVTNTITIPRSVSGGVGAVLFTPDGTRAYVIAGGVTVFDVATEQIVASLSAGMVASGAITPDGQRVYFVDGWGGAVYGFDTQTNALTSTTVVRDLPSSIAINATGTKAFVTIPAYLAMSNGVGAPAPLRVLKVIDLTTHTIAATLTTAQPPSGVALSVDGARMCVALPAAGQVLELDAETAAVVAQYPAGSAPSTLAFQPAPARAEAYGAPCPASTGPVSLVASTLPWLGSNYDATAAGLAAGALALGVVGFGSSAVPLAALHPAGVPGCALLAQPDLLVPLANLAGSALLAVPLPRNGDLIGLQLFTQVLQFTASEFSGSTGLRGTLGMR